MQTIGFGGGCHWCTEAIFQSLKGVLKVQQGWIASDGEAAEFSEAVVMDFDHEIISIATLVAVHLHTHSSTSDHSMRNKYRSAVYAVSDVQAVELQGVIERMQPQFEQPIITKVHALRKFKINKEEFQNYYNNDPEKPFCRTYISPKLRLIMKLFSKEVKADV